jgi:Arc/MetJ-type ribon-helix-helix transcriptional regulator
MAEKKSKFSTVSLPKGLVDKIKVKIKDTGFHSPSAYVAFVLRQLLSEPDSDGVFSKDEEEQIRKRLRSLGYI